MCNLWVAALTPLRAITFLATSSDYNRNSKINDLSENKDIISYYFLDFQVNFSQT